MAVSFRVVVFLVALGVFGFAYAVVDAPASGEVDAAADQQSDSEPARAFLGIIREIWSLLPVFAALAAGGWLIKESIYVRGPG